MPAGIQNLRLIWQSQVSARGSLAEADDLIETLGAAQVSGAKAAGIPFAHTPTMKGGVTFGESTSTASIGKNTVALVASSYVIINRGRHCTIVIRAGDLSVFAVELDGTEARGVPTGEAVVVHG